MPSISTIAIDLVANTASFVQSLSKAQTSSKSAFKSMQNDILAFKNIAAVQFAGAMMKDIVALVGKYDEMDGALKRMTVSISASKRAQNDLAGASKELYAALPVSIEQATDAVGALARKTGLTGQAFKDAALQAASLAKLTGGSASGVVSDASGTMKKWGMDTQNIQAYNDYIYSIAKETGLGAESISELNQQLKEASDTFGRFGYKFGDVAVLFAKLKTSGVDVNSVLSGLNSGLKKMVESGSYSSIEEAWEHIKERIQSSSTETQALQRIISDLGGSKGTAKELLELFEKMDGLMADTHITMSSITGDMRETMTEGDKLASIVKTLELSFGGVGEHLQNIAHTLIDELNTKLEKTKGFWEAISQTIVLILKNFEKIAVVATLGVNKLVEYTMSREEWKTIAENLKVINNPVQTAAGYDKAGIIMDASKAWALGQGNEITQAIVDTARGVGGLSDEQKATAKTAEDFAKSLEAVTTATTAGSDAVKEYDGWWAYTKKDMKELFGSDAPKWQGYMDELAHSMSSSMTDAFMDMTEGTKSFAQAFKAMAKSIISDIARMVIEWNISKPIASALSNAIGGFFSGTGSSGGSTGVSWIDTPVNFGSSSLLPAYASGGYVPAGQLSLIGEEGPELFMSGSGGTVIPNDKLGSSSSFQTNNHFYIQAGTPEAIAVAAKQAASAAAANSALYTADAVRRGGRYSRSIRTGR